MKFNIYFIYKYPEGRVELSSKTNPVEAESIDEVLRTLYSNWHVFPVQEAIVGIRIEEEK